MPLTLFFKYFEGLQDMWGERGSTYLIQKILKISTSEKKKKPPTTNQENRVTQLPRAQLKK